MNRDEAIDLLDNLIGMVEDNHQSDYDTALQMAIKALEQEPSTVNCNECFHDCPQWAKNIAKSNGCSGYISSVNPTKTGYWVGEDGKPSHLKDGMTTKSVWCSLCGKWLTASDEYSCFGKYCPNCGAKMLEN